MAQNDGLLLGLDVGTTNCKALLFDLAGRPQGRANVPTPTHAPAPGRVEYDPEELWTTVAATIRRALGDTDPARIQGVAVASMGEAGVLLDQRGRALEPIIAWHDSRTIEQHNWWLQHIGAQETIGLTGVTPSPIFGAYKLMWLRDHAAESYALAARWLHVADYIAFRLGGAQATDYSLGSRTMLLDLRERRWAGDFVERAGIRHDLLPDLVASGTQIGEVTPTATAETGLRAGTPIGSGGHDHVCGALAAGITEAGMCLDSMGTAEAIFLPLAKLPPTALPAGRTFGAHVARDRYYSMNSLWGGGSVDWATALLRWNVGEDARNAYERMEAAAAAAPPGSLGTLFLPNLKGNQRGAFVGLTAAARPEVVARAVYEGLAYECRFILESIEAAVGQQAQTIRVIGGGTRSAIWLQIKASVFGRRLHVLKLDESVALGAALLAGLAAGVYKNEADALASVEREARLVTPDERLVEMYERCYRDSYLRLAPALAEIHASL